MNEALPRKKLHLSGSQAGPNVGDESYSSSLDQPHRDGLVRPARHRATFRLSEGW